MPNTHEKDGSRGDEMPPVPQNSFNVPYPGHVEIHLQGMKFCFSEEDLRNAIANLQRRRATFKTEADYRSILTIYEQALRLLEEEKK